MILVDDILSGIFNNAVRGHGWCSDPTLVGKRARKCNFGIIYIYIYYIFNYIYIFRPFRPF